MKTNLVLACGLVAAFVAQSVGGQTLVRQEPSTVTVSGVGTVSVEPDMVRITVSIGKTAQTTRLAQEAVGKMTGQVLAILSENGVEKKEIKTTSFRFNPEYQWDGKKNVLAGQRVDQSIDFNVRRIGDGNDTVVRIIDRLAAIDGVAMNQINFSVAETTGHYVRSRELAFEKAMQKAQQYAQLAGLKVSRMLALSEDGANNAVPLYRATLNQFKMEAAVADAVATELPSGQIEITTRISATFLLE